MNLLKTKNFILSALCFGGCSFLNATLPDFSAWSGNSKTASRFALNGQQYNIDDMPKMLANYIKTKNLPNQKITIGYYVPIIYLAASLTLTKVLQKLLENPKTLVLTETTLGNTPMHAAAINSVECLKLLIADGRLDVNECNQEGENPLYVAMKNHPMSSSSEFDTPVKALLAASKININGGNHQGRTIFHTAIVQGQANVVGQLVALSKVDTGEKFDLSRKDDAGHSALDYIWSVKNFDARTQILEALNGFIGDSGPTQVSFAVSETQETKMKNACTAIGTAVSAAKAEVNELTNTGQAVVDAALTAINDAVTENGALLAAITDISSKIHTEAVAVLQTIIQGIKDLEKQITAIRKQLIDEPGSTKEACLRIEIKLKEIEVQLSNC